MTFLDESFHHIFRECINPDMGYQAYTSLFTSDKSEAEYVDVNMMHALHFTGFFYKRWDWDKKMFCDKKDSQTKKVEE